MSDKIINDEALDVLFREARTRNGWEAREVSRIFQFVDDIVVRVRPMATGAVIDVRSKSRDGRGDLGENAKRIRAFAAAIPR